MAAESEAKPLRDASEMVVVLDAGDRIACWNRAAEERFHLGGDEASGARLQKVYQLCWATPEEQRAAFAEVLARGAWRNQRTYTMDGKRIDIESTVSSLLNAKGQSIGKMITVRDVTERERQDAAQADRSGPAGPPSSRVEAGAGAISICASCKAMRDSGGDWHPADVYVAQRFTVAFTHGMCPECIQRFYPDLGPEASTAS
jgi:PAS domain S-box-containing protein